MPPAWFRPFQVRVRRPFGKGRPSAIRATGSPLESSTSAVTESGFRRRKEIPATSLGQRQTGEKAVGMRVPVIGLRSSFSSSVTAKAAADPPSKPRTSSVAISRAKARRILRLLRGPHHGNPLLPARLEIQDREGDDADYAAEDKEQRLGRRLRERDAARDEDGGERDPQSAVGHAQREAASKEDAGNGADEQPTHRAHVHVARDEMSEACDVEQRRRVEDVGANDLGRAEWEHGQHGQAEEHSGADRGQADDEAAAQTDRKRRDVVAPG